MTATESVSTLELSNTEEARLVKLLETDKADHRSSVMLDKLLDAQDRRRAPKNRCDVLMESTGSFVFKVPTNCVSSIQGSYVVTLPKADAASLAIWLLAYCSLDFDEVRANLDAAEHVITPRVSS